MKATWEGAAGDAIDPALLAREGLLVLAGAADPEDPDDTVEDLMEEQGYAHQRRGAPAAEDARAHTRDGELGRLLLGGELVLEVRSRDGRWMQLSLSPGDFASVPAGRAQRIRADAAAVLIELTATESAWTPRFEEPA